MRAVSRPARLTCAIRCEKFYGFRYGSSVSKALDRLSVRFLFGVGHCPTQKPCCIEFADDGQPTADGNPFALQERAFKLLKWAKAVALSRSGGYVRICSKTRRGHRARR